MDVGETIEGALNGVGGGFGDAVATGAGTNVADKDEDGVKGVTAAAAAVA